MGFFDRFMPSNPIPTSATQSIPKGSSTAIHTTWLPPSTVTSVEQASAAVQAAFEAYPCTGQGNIDKGGWQVVEGSLDSFKFRVEFTSGRGMFTKLVNVGPGFPDDVLVEILPDPLRAEVRSSSRHGMSDWGVNRKRVQFLADQMRQKGWDAPKPEYG